MIDFPASPTVGQKFTTAGVTWTWDGAKWTLTPAAGAPITIGDSPPSSPVIGALWYDSVGGQMYVWFNDGTSSQWVPASNDGGKLLPASTTVLGGVKVDGATIQAAADGTISTTVVPMGDNRLINGDMRICQRVSAGAGVIGYVADRWNYYATPTTKFNWGGGGANSGLPGFPYFAPFSSTSAYSPAATDRFLLQQNIEADVVSDFAWGTASAQPITLSFWAQSNLVGTHSGCIKDYNGVRSYPFTFSLPSTTWTKIVVTIPGDTVGAWPMSGNGGGVSVLFNLGSGSTFTAPANVWAAGNFDGANGAIRVVSTNGASWAVTGVKLEIGSVATPFNRQSLAKSMADCQRYYQKLGGAGGIDLAFQGHGTAAGGGGNITSNVGITAMRAMPTATRVGAWTTVNVSTYTLYPSISSIAVQITPIAAGSTSMYTGDATTFLTLSAEL